MGRWQKGKPDKAEEQDLLRAGRGTERQEATAEQELVGTDAPASGLLFDPRLDHPANVGRRAALLRVGQRTLGNRALQHMLQTRAIQAQLTVNPPDDVYEEEADRVADQVMRMAVPAVQRQAAMEEEEEEASPSERAIQARAAVEQMTPLIQRQAEPEEEEEEPVQAKLAVGQIAPLIQRQVEAEEEEEEQTIQRQVEPEEEEEEPVQAKLAVEQITPLIQRQAEAEEEEEEQTIQRQVEPEEEEEEESLQAKAAAGQIAPLIQRQVEAEEEEEEQTIQRQAEPEEEEEEDSLQAKAAAGQIAPLVQRQAEGEEEEDERTIQRQVEPEEEEEEESLQAKAAAGQIAPLIQRQVEAEEEEEEQTIQRQVEPEEEEEEEPIQAKPVVGQITPLVQRQVEPEEEEEEGARGAIQARWGVGGAAAVTSELEERIDALKGGGRPLSPSERAYFEPRFGRDFGGVRLHTGEGVAEVARDLQAQAFTVGENVVFGGGRYAPDTEAGRRLLAHELTHVVQQTGPGERPSAEAPPPVARTSPEGLVQRDDGPSLYERAVGAVAEGLYQWDPLNLRTYSVASVLQERDGSKVQQLTRSQIDAASPDQCWRLIHLALQQGWVGPDDETAIRMIWQSLEARGQLLQVANQHSGLWQRSIDAGVELEDLRTVTDLKQRFEQDVKAIANHYLGQNREYVGQQMGSLGIRVPQAGGPQTMAGPRARPGLGEQQAGRLREIQALAQEVARAQEAERLMRQIPVGYRTEYVTHPMMPRAIPTTRVVHFDPDRGPEDPPRGNETPRMADYREVKSKHEELTAYISGIANRCPAIYALIREERVEELSRVQDQQEALDIVSGTLRQLYFKIGDTQGALRTGQLDYRDLKPIHAQMQRGRVSGSASTGETQWSQPLPRWVGREVVEDHEDTEFWTNMALGGVAAIAFLVAELATFGGATFFVAAGVGLAATGTQVARSWDQYYQLAQASESNVRDDLALVSQGQVSAALLSAVIDTVFAFLDLYGLGRVARTGLRAAEEAAEALAEGAARVAIPDTIDLAASNAGEILERSIRELGVPETLNRAGLGTDQIGRLTDLLPEGSAARAQLEAYSAAGGRLAAEQLENLETVLRELVPGAAHNSDVVLRAIGEYGYSGTIRRAGGWKRLSTALGEGTQAGERLEAWRVGLYEELRRFIADLPGGNEALRTGTQRFSSDMDISILGPNSAEYRDRAVQFLAGRTGTSPGADLSRMLDCDVFTDPRRMHFYDYLDPLARERMAREVADFEEQLLWNTRLYSARQAGDELLAAELREQMGRIGVPVIPSYRPLSRQNIAYLNRELDNVAQRFNAARQAGNRAEQERLTRRIGQIQAQINAAEGGGYFTGGGVRRWVSERLGENIPPLVGRPQLLLRSEEVVAMLDNLFHIEDAQRRMLQGIVSAFAEGRSTAGAVAKGLKDLGKYGGRIRQVVGEGLGRNIPSRASFDQVADTFSDLLARHRAGTLGAAAASQEAQVLLGRASRAMNQLEEASVEILQALRSQAGMGAPSSSLRGINALTHLHGYYLRARDVVRSNMQALIQAALRPTTATTRLGGEEGQERAAEQPVQPKRLAGVAPVVPPKLEQRLDALEGGGRSLSVRERRFFEPRFGRDFGAVRLHTDDGAAEVADALKARAFVVGPDIVFGVGRYAPETKEGKTLLAHELTHVVQQTRPDQRPSADGPLPVVRTSPGGLVQRDDGPGLYERAVGAVAEGLYSWDPLRLRTYSVQLVLRDQDPDLVSRLTRPQIAQASVPDRLRLIQLALRGDEEDSIETIWGTFNRRQLLEITGSAENMQLWRRCTDAGADLDELPAVRELAQDFRRQVKAVAWYYLRQNRDYALNQMRSLGIQERATMVRAGLTSAPLAYPPAATMTARQVGAVLDIQDIAAEVNAAQEAERALGRIRVGYNWVETGSYRYGETWTRLEEAHFDPNRQPQRPPRGNERPPMASWAEVKRHYDQLAARIGSLANRVPVIYALIRENRVGEVARARDAAEAQRAIGEALHGLVVKIDETQSKLDTDRLDYRELRPIHAQLFGGRAPAVPGVQGLDWSQPLPCWVGEEEIRGHERAEFWLSLGLSSLAAAAFVIAEVATVGGATFFIAAGVGIGASALQAGRSWENYLNLAQAAETNLRDEMALVSREQVQAALLTATLDTALAFLDLYGVGRAARAARAAGAARQALRQAGEEIAEPAAIRPMAQAGARSGRLARLRAAVQDHLQAIRERVFRQVTISRQEILRELELAADAGYDRVVRQMVGANRLRTLSRSELVAFYGREGYRDLLRQFPNLHSLGGFYDPAREIMFIRAGSREQVSQAVVHETTHYLQDLYGGPMTRFMQEFQAFKMQQRYLQEVALEGMEHVPPQWRWIVNATDGEIEQFVERAYGLSRHVDVDDVDRAVEHALEMIRRF